MRISSAAVRTLSATAAFLSLTALAGAAPQRGPSGPPTARWFGNTSGTLIYVAQYDNGLGPALVQVISAATHKVVGEIQNVYAQRMATDLAGNLYLTLGSFQNPAVLVFAPGVANPIRTIPQTGYEPSGLTVTANGTLYLANFCQGDGISCFGDGYTVVYPRTGPPHYLDVVGAPALVVVDSSGRLAISGLAFAPTGDFPKYVPESVASDLKGGYQQIVLKVGRRSVPQMAFDTQGRLAVLAQDGAGTSFLEIVRLPQDKAVARLPLPGVVFDFAFPPGGNHIWIGTNIVSGGVYQPVAEELTYPGGKLVATVPITQAYGSNSYMISLTISPQLIH